MLTGCSVCPSGTGPRRRSPCRRAAFGASSERARRQVCVLVHLRSTAHLLSYAFGWAAPWSCRALLEHARARACRVRRTGYPARRVRRTRPPAWRTRRVRAFPPSTRPRRPPPLRLQQVCSLQAVLLQRLQAPWRPRSPCCHLQPPWRRRAGSVERQGARGGRSVTTSSAACTITSNVEMHPKWKSCYYVLDALFIQKTYMGLQ